jgi:hypothetical protein
MRSITFVVAAFIASGPAAAQGWQEYTYPDFAFAVAFPAEPQIETTTYKIADGRSVQAHVYSVRQNNVILKMTIAELGAARPPESAVIDHAIKTLSEGGKVEVNIPHRIYRVYGRQLTIAGADGSHNMAAVFDYKGRLYQIEGKALAGANADDNEFDAVRFQQSLTFTDNGSNRSEEAIKALRDACPGQGNPAGLDDPRCVP